MVELPTLALVAIGVVALATAIGALHVLAVRLDETIRLEQLRLDVREIRRRYEESLRNPPDAEGVDIVDEPTAGVIAPQAPEAARAAA